MAPDSLLIKRAKLRDRTDLVNISISDGKITGISSNPAAPAAKEIDAGGNLVTEAFANAHLHLCKVYTLQMMDEEALTTYLGLDNNMGKTMKGIELAARVKEKYDESWIIKNVRRALVEAAKYGCINIRALADVDNKARFEGVKRSSAARDEFKDVLNIQVVAFAQDGLAGNRVQINSCVRRWTSEPMSWVVFPGSSIPTRIFVRMLISAMISQKNSINPYRCWSMMPVMQVCGPWIDGVKPSNVAGRDVPWVIMLVPWRSIRPHISRNWLPCCARQKWPL